VKQEFQYAIEQCGYLTIEIINRAFNAIKKINRSTTLILTDVNKTFWTRKAGPKKLL